MFLIDMKFISMLWEILFNQCSLFAGVPLHTNYKNDVPIIRKEKRYIGFQKNENDSHIFYNTIFQKGSHIFLYSLKYIGMMKCIDMGLYGFENPEIMEFGSFDVQHNKIGILLNQSGAD